MPGIVAHMAVAKTVGEELNINSDEFYQGNLLPDILKRSKVDSHFKKQGRIYKIPNTLYYRETFDLDQDLNFMNPISISTNEVFYSCDFISLIYFKYF